MTTTTTPSQLPPREQLLQGSPVTERRVTLAGIPTAILEGGEGPPIILLHGPGEFAGKWLRVFPQLVQDHRVIAPDLPYHGESGGPEPAEPERMLPWLDALIDQCAPSPPVLVGHVLGGALAARYAAQNWEKLSRLVLVDSLGLARFLPAPRFALTMVRFLRKPTERNYDSFMRQCSRDLDDLKRGMGERWGPFVAYNLESARSPRAKAVGEIFRKVGLPRIPPAELRRITVPTHLIWGRHDRANRVRTAQRISTRYGWPLQVIEDCADDPARDRPAEFLRALDAALTAPAGL